MKKSHSLLNDPRMSSASVLWLILAIMDSDITNKYA